MLPRGATDLRLPDERLASCDDCYKAALGHYRDDCRCCTCLPQMPNFMLGLALDDPRSADRVRRQIRLGNALPLGLVSSPRRYLAAVQSQARGQFGQLPAELCPFVERETFHCTVYPYRNSICSTFFCVHDHGPAGAEYWDRVQALAGHMESSLAQWAMGRAGLKHGRYLSRMNSLAADVPELARRESMAWPAEALKHLWGPLLGQQEAFFKACAEQVMARRSELYTLACAHPFAEAVEYEAALSQAIPDQYCDDSPAEAGEPGQFLPIETLWYQLQLATRNLWALPFGEGPVVLSPRMALGPNPGDDVLARRASDRPWCVHGPGADPGQEVRLFLSAAEAALLRLFEQPRVLGEALLERAEVEAVDDARGLMARWVRWGVLEAFAASSPATPEHLP